MYACTKKGEWEKGSTTLESQTTEEMQPLMNKQYAHISYTQHASLYLLLSLRVSLIQLLKKIILDSYIRRMHCFFKSLHVYMHERMYMAHKYEIYWWKFRGKKKILESLSSSFEQF